MVGYGHDIIDDSDKNGTVWWGASSEEGGFRLQGSTGVAAVDWVQLSATSWVDRQHTIYYTLVTAWDGSTRLQVSAPGMTDGTGRVWIENFVPGNYGIALPGSTLGQATGYLVEPDPETYAGVLYGEGTEDHHMVGSVDADSIYAGDGVDWIEAGLGRDRVMGRAGNDFLFASVWRDPATGAAAPAADDAAGDLLDGGAGDDLIVGEAGADLVFGGSGSDVIHGDAGDDLIFGDGTGGGNGDWSVTRDVTLNPDGSWNFTSTLTGVAMDIDGDGDADVILAGAGADFVHGMEGNDFIDGGEGNDALWGGNGADTLLGGDGDDHLMGGHTMILNADGTQGYTTVIDPEDVGDLIDGGAGDDRIYGNAGDDTLVGGSGDDVIQGNDGNDSLRGGTDNDELIAGEGDDVLSGYTHQLRPQRSQHRRRQRMPVLRHERHRRNKNRLPPSPRLPAQPAIATRAGVHA